MLHPQQFISSNPGPSVGVLAITHGNEPVGLEVFDRLRIYLQHSPIIQGSLTLVPVNTAAYLHLDKNNKHTPVRYIDADMNRIWKQDRSGSGVEFCRRDELLPLISSFDFVLDIHSVPDGDFCAGITAPHLAGEISKWCNAPYILLGATEGAVIGPMIGKGGKGFGLEAGNHLSDLSLDRAWENTLRFLQYTAIINVLDNMPVAKQRVFQFKKEILPESNGFLFIEQTEEFHPISPNAIYAIDGTKVLRNLSPGTLFTGIRNEYAKKGKSAGFIFEEVC